MSTFVDQLEIFFAAVSAAEHGNSNSSLTTDPGQGDTSLTAVSPDGNSTVAEPVSQSTTEETASFPVATSDTNDTLLASKPSPLSVGSVKRKRGRPPLHSYQAVERRHQKLVDVCMSLRFYFYFIIEKSVSYTHLTLPTKRIV